MKEKLFSFFPGFLLGTRQTLLETKDAGRSWNSRSIPSAEDEDFNYRYEPMRTVLNDLLQGLGDKAFLDTM